MSFNGFIIIVSTVFCFAIENRELTGTIPPPPFDPFQNEDHVFNRTNGSAIDINESSTLLDIPALLKLRFTNVSMECNVFVLRVELSWRNLSISAQDDATSSPHRQNAMTSRLAYGPG
jgi:hypothetical protein